MAEQTAHPREEAASNLIEKTLRYRGLIFWILAFCYILVYFHRLCPAVVAVDMMQDLKAGGALTGLLAAAYFYPYAIMQLPAGLLSDSWGPRNTITLFFSIAFAGSLILGYAPTVAWAITGRALVGLGVAMLFVPTMKVLAAGSRRHDRHPHGPGRHRVVERRPAAGLAKLLAGMAPFLCRRGGGNPGARDSGVAVRPGPAGRFWLARS